MISASLSLSLPRLGWKSTSMPRSLKICTAAGDSASEMRTLGFVMGEGFPETRTLMRGLNRLSQRGGRERCNLFSLSPFLRGEGWGEGLYRQTRIRGESPSPGAELVPDGA